MEKLESLIGKYPFFRGMRARHLKEITRHAARVTFRAGEAIFEDGERADRFYLLMDGRIVVELYSPGYQDLLIQTLSAGDVLGWSWLVPPYQWRFNARAIAQTHAVGFDARRLRALCDRDQELGYEIQKRFLIVITARVESASLQLLDLYGLPGKSKKTR
ncbi:MAG: cyclic nucleotide-binding domain-containing protein [Candidatus Omnitrophica bacterium]|nr:cyclic nucleotide-binding domain-containing protein [Candidatus Omnitrophota bacterium]